MALIPTNLDYTDKDQASILARLNALISSVFPTWSDRNVANFGNILIGLYSFVGDTLGFYQDNQARESRILTATQRKNIIALVKLIGFSPAGAAPAQVDETFTLRAVPTGSVTFPAGSIVSTADVTSPISFQLLEDLVIAGGTNPPTATATVEHSETHLNAFDSTGLPNQSFVLSQTPYIDDSAVVVADDGTYTQVDNFLDSISSDRHFIIGVDQNDRATVAFGNGTNGKIPVGSIAIDIKTGGGSSGNVEAGSLNRLQGMFFDSFGTAVQVDVTNVERASGGIDRQTNAQIQTLAPQSVRATERSVAREDFEIHALKNASVARALMTTSNEDPGVAENSGILYIVPQGGGAPSQALKDAVRALFIRPSPSAPKPRYPSTLTFRLSVQTPLYLPVNVFSRVFFRAGVLPSRGALAIRTALADFFKISLEDGTPNPTIDFGYNYLDASGTPFGTIGLGAIFDVINDVPEVLRVGGSSTDFLLNSAHADVPILSRQFPTLGSIILQNGTDGSLV